MKCPQKSHIPYFRVSLIIKNACKKQAKLHSVSREVKGILPNRFIRQLRANEAIFLSSVSLLLDYNGTTLSPQRSKTSVQK